MQFKKEIGDILLECGQFETCEQITDLIGQLRLVVNDVAHYRSVALSFTCPELYSKLITVCIGVIESGEMTIYSVIGTLEMLITIYCNTLNEIIARGSAE
jgi:hypothetical protein